MTWTAFSLEFGFKLIPLYSQLEAFYRGNFQEFSDKDFQLMFAMNGPRRRGDIGRYHMLKKKLNIK